MKSALVLIVVFALFCIAFASPIESDIDQEVFDDLIDSAVKSQDILTSAEMQGYFRNLWKKYKKPIMRFLSKTLMKEPLVKALVRVITKYSKQCKQPKGNNIKKPRFQQSEIFQEKDTAEGNVENDQLEALIESLPEGIIDQLFDNE